MKKYLSTNARKYMTCSVLLSALFVSAGFTSAGASDSNYTVVHDERGNVVRNTFGNCVRTKWLSSQGDECGVMVQAPTPQVGAPAPYVERTEIAIAARTVYFEFNKARLTESERRKLDSLTEILKSKKDIRGVRIVGYADRIGKATYNERLSRHRSEAVEKYLRERGYLSSTLIQVRWFGSSVPSTHCSNRLSRAALIACLEKDRRVEIELEYNQ